MYRTFATSALVLGFFIWLPAMVLHAQVDGPSEIVIPGSPSADEMNRAKQKIAEFLQKNKATEQVKKTGDPLVEDVLDVIRRRGSVLDGSSLDPNQPLPSVVNSNSADLGISPLMSSGDGAYLTAEQLLKAARSLQRLQVRDAADEELARLLRRRAAKLLIDAISEESVTREGHWQGRPMQEAAP